MLFKHCPRCGQNLGINFFYRRNKKDYHGICMNCQDALFKNKPPNLSD